MIRRIFCIAFLCSALVSFAQMQNIDKTIAVVGKHIILRSELERELKSLRNENITINDSVRCSMLEEMLYQKLLLAQAEKDSVKVKDEQVDNELDRRMNVYLHQFGSEEKFESFYGKSVKQYKEELRDDIRDLLVAQQMQNKIIGEVKVSPADIRAYFNAIPEDSLPNVNTELEICQLMKKPEVSEEAKKIARQRIEAYRQEVLQDKKSMTVVATLYTEDPGSAKTGGRYDGIGRGMFMPQFEAVAFRLKPGEISEVFETPYGYHFIKLIARRGELVDLQHLLITPKISNEDVTRSKIKLDSIYNEITEGKISFCNAVAKYSDDKETKNNCGILVNNQQGTNRFEIEELGQIDQNLVFTLDKMKVDDISKPLPNMTPDGKQIFRIIYLKNRTEPHKINLKDDYQRLQNMAQSQKQKSTVNTWINRKLKNTYVRIDSEYRSCRFKHNWLQISQ